MNKYIVLFLLTILSVTMSWAQDTSITLPIEVLGAEKTVVSVNLNLSNQQASSAKYLWLQVNNLSYEGKGSVKVNNGPWVELNHDNVRINPKALTYGGMAHGGFNTIRLSLPADNWRAGDNRVRFRFDLSDGISNGYRIIRMNVLDAGRVKLLSSDHFRKDDPRQWEPPYDTPEAIERGRRLWYNAELWNHYLHEGRRGFWYGSKLPGTRRIKANCSSCHTQDGRDLEMFSYSNKSIIERAKFHKLTGEQGRLIASYIRSLSSEHKNVERVGRPWNPPYQPGPRVANRPVKNWFAGAGLDAVLDKDEDMLDYMMPDGISRQSVKKYFDPDKTEDRSTTPVAIQFPDWKHWLPMIHPMDAYTINDYWNDESIQRSPKRAYEELRELLENNPNPDSATLTSAIQSFGWDYRAFHHQSTPENAHWRTKSGDAYNAIRNNIPPEFAKTSLARLRAVQYFEVFNEFNLQSKAQEFYNKKDKVTERQWIGRVYHVFEIPPHFTSCETSSGCKSYVGQKRINGRFETSMWYELQLVLGGGDGVSGGNAPVDWQYHFNFIKGLSRESGIMEPARYFRSINAIYQIKTWSGQRSPNETGGFRMRQMGPGWWYSLGPSGTLAGPEEEGDLIKKLNEVHPKLAKWVLDAMLRNFLDEMDKPINNLEDWKRTDGGSDHLLDIEGPTPPESLSDFPRDGGYNWSYQFYWLIDKFDELGADEDLLTRLVDWCQRAWPSWDWSERIPGNELMAKAPYPVDGQSIFSRNQVRLSCDIGGDAEFSTVYFGRTQNLTNRHIVARFESSERPYYQFNKLRANTTYYWRVDTRKANSTEVKRGKVWEFNTNDPVRNLALKKKVRTSSSFESSHLPRNINDGDNSSPDSKWVSKKTDVRPWVEVVLGDSSNRHFYVSGMEFFTENGDEWKTASIINDFQLQYYAGNGEWIDAYSLEGYDRSKLRVGFDPVRTWKVRFNVSKFHGRSVRLLELGIFGERAPMNNLALRKPVTFSSARTNISEGSKAVDGNIVSDTSRWVSTKDDETPWIEIDLARGRDQLFDVSEVEFFTGADGNYHSPIRDFVIQYRHNNKWRNVRRVTRNTLAAYNAIFDPVRTSRIRLKVNEASDNYVKLYEIRVYGQRYTSSNTRLLEEDMLPSSSSVYPISLYPNPATSRITIMNYDGGDTSSTLYDLSGKVLPVEIVDGQMDISHLTRGIYFFKHKNKMHRFVKE